MVIRRRDERKRRARREGGEPPDDARDEARDDQARADDTDEDLEARLDSVTSRFATPPTPEELRAAFRRRDREAPPEPTRQDFASRYSADSLFSPTIDEPIDPITGEAEDRSRTRGDYYYDPDDAWAVLGVRPGASWADITAAHRRLAMVHHPDRLLDSTPEQRAESEATMRDVNVAYSVLRRLTGH